MGSISSIKGSFGGRRLADNPRFIKILKNAFISLRKRIQAEIFKIWTYLVWGYLGGMLNPKS